MEKANFDRMMAVFEKAMEHPPEARLAQLKMLCGDDKDLREQVESLLQQAEADDGFLESNTPGSVVREHLESLGNAIEKPHPEIKIPARIGPYRILKLLGRGGMGSVYEAEQEKPRRRIALKVLRAPYLCNKILSRFERESQILGRLRHPGIAHIYEAGVATGSDGEPIPYFAMEIVDGIRLTDYAVKHDLDLRARLSLVARVCDAVEHAHSHGVIHRDLKPDNILVDQRGEPKVLDFGVARISDPDLIAASMATMTGQMIGTLAYMSPEQVDARPEDIDARSDVYALGVIAFELLAGHLPLDLATVSFPEAVRRIREIDPQRLDFLDRRYRGDVATIIAKALAKEPHLRYASAADLSRDIQRYLADQPIVAKPQSGIYQLRKFATRNRAIVTGVLIAFMALLTGAIVASRQAVIAHRERAHAVQQKLRAQRQAYRAQLVTAGVALDSNNTELARMNLEAAPDALRGWEWEHLYSRLDQSSLTIHTGTGRYTELRFAPGEDRIVAYDRSSQPVYLLPISLSPDAQKEERYLVGMSRTLKATPEVRWQAIRSLYFSRGESQVELVDPEGGPSLLLKRCGPLSEGLGVLGLAADGRRAVLASAWGGDPLQREARLCDLSTGEGGPAFQMPYGLGFALSSDGSLIAASTKIKSKTDRIHLISTADGSTVATFHIPFDDITSLDLSGDGNRLIAGSLNGTLRLWDVKSQKLLAEQRTHGSKTIRVVRFSPDSSRIASAGDDRNVCLWPLGLDSPVVLHGHTESVIEVRFSPDGTRLVSSDLGGVLRLWKLGGLLSEPQVLRGHETYVNPIDYSPDGRLIASGAWDGTIRIWDATTGEELTMLRPAVEGVEEFGVLSLAISPDGSYLTAGTNLGDLFLYSLASLQQVAHARLPSDIYQLEYGPDGSYIMAGTFSDELFLLDAHTLDEVGREPFGLPSSWSPDGTRVLLRDSETTLIIRQGLSGPTLARLDGVDDLTFTAAWSHDGDRIVTASLSGDVVLWEAGTGRKLGSLDTHTDRVYTARFHPDGKRVATGAADGAIRLFDPETREELAQMKGHKGYVFDLAWSPDGKTLASSSEDATIHLNHTESLREINALRERWSEDRVRASRLVQDLFSEGVDPESIAEQLQSDLHMDPELRKAALTELLLHKAP